jgi:hypothetical protein
MTSVVYLGFGKAGRLNHGERGSASLHGGLGALPPAGSRGEAPEAESYLPMSRQILPGFLHVYCFVLKLPCTQKTRKIIEAELTEYLDSKYDLTFDLT